MVRSRVLPAVLSAPVVAVLAIAFLAAPGIEAGRPDDEVAVRQAVLDYVEGIYEVDPSRIERGVHKELRKTGFWYSDEKKKYEGPLAMTYQELHDLAGRWNKEGRVDPSTAVKKVEIYEVSDKTAAAKLTADWGIDYMHLAKYDGRWKIINVLWQSPPLGD